MPSPSGEVVKQWLVQTGITGFINHFEGNPGLVWFVAFFQVVVAWCSLFVSLVLFWGHHTRREDLQDPKLQAGWPRWLWFGNPHCGSPGDEADREKWRAFAVLPAVSPSPDDRATPSSGAEEAQQSEEQPQKSRGQTWR